MNHINRIEQPVQAVERLEAVCVSERVAITGSGRIHACQRYIGPVDPLDCVEVKFGREAGAD